MIFVLVLVSTVAAIYTGYQGLPLYWVAILAVLYFLALQPIQRDLAASRRNSSWLLHGPVVSTMTYLVSNLVIGLNYAIGYLAGSMLGNL
ncbi:MAG: hypothetical protein PVJ15_00365 [Gammaproteobacteria bacterium]|jgi:hypothetical protein